MALVKCEFCSNEQDDEVSNICDGCGREIAPASPAESLAESIDPPVEAAEAVEAEAVEAQAEEAAQPAGTIATCEYCGHQQDIEVSMICDNCGRKMGRVAIPKPVAAKPADEAPAGTLTKCEYCSHEQDIAVSRLCDNCGRKMGRTSTPAPAKENDEREGEMTRCPICAIRSSQKVCPNCGNIKRA